MEMNVVVGKPRTGKTTEAMQWLMTGTLTSQEPYWSRILVVSDIQRVKVLLETHRAENEQLIMTGVVNGLYALVFPWSQFKQLGLSRTLEIGVENLELLAMDILARHPSFATLEGSLYRDLNLEKNEVF